MKILWLCSWYPNKLKPFDGDFIQRHARAVSLIHQVHVLFIKKDDEGKITKNVKEETTTTGNLSETIIYYYSNKTGISVIDKVISNKRYKKLYKKWLQNYINENNKPSFIHVHVAMKAGMIAIWFKRKFNIQFILSEHWTGYLPEAKPNLSNENFVFKKYLKEIFSQATKVTAVSNVLAQSLKENFNVGSGIIPNVVDTDIFYPATTSVHSVTRFIHISTNTYQKNTKAILQSFKAVKNAGYDFELIFYVPEAGELQLLVNKYELDTEVIIHEEVPQKILANDLRNCDALVLYSRYETFGCVVIEANACGLPAILSDLPVFREYSFENKTALFAIPDNYDALAEVIMNFIQDKSRFDHEQIAELTRKKFNYSTVAKQFDDLYKEVITEIQTSS